MENFNIDRKKKNRYPRMSQSKYQTSNAKKTSIMFYVPSIYHLHVQTQTPRIAKTATIAIAIAIANQDQDRPRDCRCRSPKQAPPIRGCILGFVVFVVVVVGCGCILYLSISIFIFKAERHGPD
jgi:hypothetical protein